VTLTGFGTFRVSQRTARTGTNVRTGQKIQIPAQWGVNFSAGSELKAQVRGEGGAYLL
jgi:DNA-binding protein HU-beta